MVLINIEMHDKKVAKVLSDSNELVKRIGLDKAKILKRRLNEIMASDNFSEYLNIGIGKPHRLVGNLDGCYGIHLTANYRLIIEPLVDTQDNASLEECKNINIKGVGDYHDGKCEWIIP